MVYILIFDLRIYCKSDGAECWNYVISAASTPPVGCSGCLCWIYFKANPTEKSVMLCGNSLRSAAVQRPFAVVLLAIMMSSAILKGHWLAAIVPSVSVPPSLFRVGKPTVEFMLSSDDLSPPVRNKVCFM